VPKDDRVLETWAGVAALGVVGGSLVYEGVAPLFDQNTFPATLFLFITAVGFAWDVAKGEWNDR